MADNHGLTWTEAIDLVRAAQSDQVKLLAPSLTAAERSACETCYGMLTHRIVSALVKWQAAADEDYDGYLKSLKGEA